MTPEEIARAVVEPWYRGPYNLHGSSEMLKEVADIAAAIRAERERAEQAVLSAANSLPADVDDGFYAGYKAAVRAALVAIRALP